MPSADVVPASTPPASLGPPVDGGACPLGEGVLACIVAALVVVIVFLAALAFTVLLLACSSSQPRARRRHHRKRRRWTRREEEGAFRGTACSARAEHGSSGRASPDGSPYHPRYNSPATSTCCEDFRMPILHSTTCTQFHTAASCHLMSGDRQVAAGTTRPPSGDASATSGETDSLEWDNFQPPLVATRTVSPADEEESLSAASQLEQPAQGRHWL
ncbi:uncharacterized protein LOC144110525 [Amblyomma americanum]